MGTSIRMRTSASLARPTRNDRGQLIAGSATTLKVAFWIRKKRKVISTTGEVDNVEALAFAPADTDVKRGDELTVASVVYEVMEVVPGADDRGVTDHIGLKLQGKV